MSDPFCRKCRQPLDTTPLADELRTLRARVAELERENALLSAPCPTCGSSVYTCVDCDVTPLRARVAELERDVLALTGPVTPEMLSRLSDVQAYVRSAEPLEHTRQVADLADAFEARAEKAEADLAAMTEQWKAELNHANAWMRKYQAAEAQVAAARAECAGLIGRPWSRWAGDAGRDVLRAMDEAAK